MKGFQLPPAKPLVIAEIALAHDGSLGNAIAFIRACADAGAGAVKFQCHNRDPNTEWREGVEHPQDPLRADYWARTGFRLDQWAMLQAEAKRCGVWFGITPFSRQALHTIKHLVDFLKIARQHAGEPLHQMAEDTRVSVIYTGYGGLGLDCYNPQDHVGLSCHKPYIDACLAAHERGAMIFEKHICWSRKQFGPDTPFSITIDELAVLCQQVERKSENVKVA